MMNTRLKNVFSLSSKVTVYVPAKDLRNKLDQVIDLCEDLKKEMTQDAIALEVNGEMFFI